MIRPMPYWGCITEAPGWKATRASAVGKDDGAWPPPSRSEAVIRRNSDGFADDLGQATAGRGRDGYGLLAGVAPPVRSRIVMASPGSSPRKQDGTVACLCPRNSRIRQWLR